ncbi:DUF418 domain-containing protein [Bacillus thuringiensis]
MSKRTIFPKWYGEALILLSGYLFQLTGTHSYFYTVFICIGIYIIQIVCSIVWLQFFRMGPLEYIWRFITYWKFIPIRR